MLKQRKKDKYFTIFIAIYIALTGILLNSPSVAFASGKFYKAKVIDVLSESSIPNEQGKYQQKLSLELLEGPNTGKYITVSYGDVVAVNKDDKLKLNDFVIVEETGSQNSTGYHIDDRFRLDKIIYIIAVFFVLAIIFGKLKGITSILGLVVSFAIISLFILPNILNGSNPLQISLFGAFLIAVFSIYLAHGINLKTSIALVSTLITLILTTLMAVVFVYITMLSGTGNEDALFVQLGYNSSLNLKGLLLGGIIIGTLGVLDDITTAQVAAVYEIHHANPSLNFYELYKRGTNVGKEHIASLINTLVLAYTGASLPLMLLFIVNKEVPLWVTFNSQFIAEEIVRTLVGSSGLILAVPISTLLASYFFGIKKLKSNSLHHSHLHAH